MAFCLRCLQIKGLIEQCWEQSDLKRPTMEKVTEALGALARDAKLREVEARRRQAPSERAQRGGGRSVQARGGGGSATASPI
jgi:hypothetical protein